MAADGGRQDTEPKTRTPHKDVGKKRKLMAPMPSLVWFHPNSGMATGTSNLNYIPNVALTTCWHLRT